jgi:hypothetical protein
VTAGMHTTHFDRIYWYIKLTKGRLASFVFV